MSFARKPKTPKPPAPTVLTPAPFNPTPAQAAAPMAATQTSADSNVGRSTGTQTFINQLAPRNEERRKRTLLGGA